MSELNRYSIISNKNPREIILLRGNGCKWKKCRFCDYHLDYSPNSNENYLLNKKEIEKVTGIYKCLEVINSGSFVDLDKETFLAIREQCKAKNILEIHFECHWMHKDYILDLRNFFGQDNIQIKIKIGVETFYTLFRESYLHKGITTDSPAEIASYFDEACLLFGLPGQTVDSMRNDIETGLRYFERICINIMVENSKPIKPDPDVIDVFMTKLYPIYKDYPKIDILIHNTDFGVGDK